MPHRGKCNQRGQTCIFFDLERVEYNETHCQVTNQAAEIKFSVRGRKSLNHNARHNFKAEVIEQGNIFPGKSAYMLFAKPIPRQKTFQPSYIQETGDIDTAGSAEIRFLVKKSKMSLSGARGVVVTCKFSHGTDPNEANWCDSHVVSIILLVQ